MSIHKYEEIWTKLLKSKTRTLKVRCKEELQKRLVKAVFKEKGLDKKNRTEWRMEAKAEGDVIEFKLRQKVNLLEV